MSSYLLDSHVLIWWLADSSELNEIARIVIENPQNDIFISVATVWEIAIKQAMGKLHVADNLQQVIIDSQFRCLSISAQHAEYAAKLPMYHRDPFDRMLIAQASIEQIPLISHDAIFNSYLPFPFIEV